MKNERKLSNNSKTKRRSGLFDVLHVLLFHLFLSIVESLRKKSYLLITSHSENENPPAPTSTPTQPPPLITTS